MIKPVEGGRDLVLDGMIRTIEEQIQIAQELSCGEASKLLQMTKLALQMERHAISVDELKSFCAAVEDRVPSTQNPNAAGRPFNTRQSALRPHLVTPSRAKRRQ
jgi:hypothetical protein